MCIPLMALPSAHAITPAGIAPVIAPGAASPRFGYASSCHVLRRFLIIEVALVQLTGPAPAATRAAYLLVEAPVMRVLIVGAHILVD